MAHFTRKEINEIIQCTPKELDNKTYVDFPVEWVGSYKAPSWNWCYKVGAIVLDGRARLVVFQFGHIVAR